MKHIDIQVKNSFEISGSLNIPIVENTGSIPTGINSGSIFFNKEDNKMYIASASQYLLVGAQALSPPPPPSADIEYLVVAGGGGGGNGPQAQGSGGGGAGGLISSSLSTVLSGSSFTIAIGAGGTPGNNGVTSSIAGTTITTIEALGGGAGGGVTVGANGGSGGGGAVYNVGYNGGSGTTGQGTGGGSGDYNSNSGGGGGGGAGGVGTDANGSSNAAAAGGQGRQSNITGTPTYYAAGGGGGKEQSSGTHTSTNGIGGKGADINDASTPGASNSGAGGGGSGKHSYSSNRGSSGGSGVIILAYDSGSINGVGGIIGDAGNGRKYHQFNSSGIFKAGATSDFGIVTDSLVVHLDAGNFASRGTSTWTDLTGNGYNGTPTNGPTLGNNFYYTLDGSNDTIRFTENSNMINTSTMSIEMWLAVGNLGSNYSQFITNRSSTAGDYSTTMAFGVDNRQVVRTWNPSGTDTMVVAAHIGNSAGNASYYAWSNNMFGTTDGDGNFHHVVMTFSSGTLKLYYDGSLVNTNSSGPSTLWAGDEYYRIGGEYSPGDYTYNLPADIGQVRFYHKELSASEVSQNYNATKTNFV